MTSRFEKERTKQIQDKCQDLLTQMLRDEDNKYCVDCDAKGPRWASWNLGIFLCIRCAGIHRNLGVHISKVKSVNLDTWTPEQVVSLQQMGNSRARAVYEANLPDTFRRPQTDCSLESFIRAKYEHKKYIAREWVPPVLPKVNWDKELDEESEKQKRRKKEVVKSTTNQSALPPVKKPQVVPQLPKPHSSVSPVTTKVTSNTNSNTLDLLGLDGPTSQTATNGSGDDIFSSFLSATPETTTNSTNGSSDVSSTGATKLDEDSFFNQPAPTPQEKSKMTKDSILALYGTPSQHPQANFGVTPYQFPHVGAFSTNHFNSQNPLGQRGIFNQPPATAYQFPHVGAFSANHFDSQNPLGQMEMPLVNNQVNLGLGNPLGNSFVQQMGPINQINALMSDAQPAIPQMIQTAQPNSSNNGWSSLSTTQSIQPAPGNNPFFNLPTQTPTAFTSTLSQEMTQMSLSGLSKPATNQMTG